MLHAVEGQQRVCTLGDHTSSLQAKVSTLTARIWARAGTLYASEGRQRMCSPGERGWVIAGETWPGQLLSFLRDPINATRWRDVKARPHARAGFCRV